MTTLRDTAFKLLASHLPDPEGRNVSTPKLLRALMQFAPTARGCENVCHEVVGCCSATTGEVDSAMLDELAHRYQTRLLVPMVAQGGKTPSVTSHPSRPSVDLTGEINETMIEDAKHDSYKLKELALRRDGFRSLMSGILDEEAIHKSLVEGDSSEEDTTLTQVAHIIPFSLAHAHDERMEGRNKSDIWEVIARFCGEDIFDELNKEGINRLENVLTLSVVERAYFEKLVCWLEATDEPNVYTVRGRRSIKSAYTIGKIVRLETTNDLLALPDPRYLALHAACAQVIHACGLGEYIDRIVRDMEELPVLPEDGCSDALLFALHQVPVC